MERSSSHAAGRRLRGVAARLATRRRRLLDRGRRCYEPYSPPCGRLSAAFGALRNCPRLAGPATITPFARGKLRRIPPSELRHPDRGRPDADHAPAQDENHLIAERRARRLARRQPVPSQRFLAREHRRQARRALWRQRTRGAGGHPGRGQGGRPHHAQAHHGQGELRHHPGPLRPHPALRAARRGGRDVYAQFKTWDIGDIVGCVGTVFKTKTGELTVRPPRSACSPRACARCPTSSTASPTSSRSTASAMST